MKSYKTLYVPNRTEWRAWLAKNVSTSDGVWLIFYRKGAGRPTIEIEDSIEEALCFGWIDSLIQRIDDDKYVRLFTPRKLKSKWSITNKKRIARLIKEGRMTQAGLAKLDYSDPDKENPDLKSEQAELLVPPAMKKALVANGKAWENFKNLAPSYRRVYIRFVMDAKREETRNQRIAKAADLLAQNKKLGMQ